MVMDVLSRTPGVVRELVAGADPRWTGGNYGEGTWSAAEVVGHLITAERDDWMPRVRRILKDGEAVPFDPFPHQATKKPAPGQGLDGFVREFGELRALGLAELRGLSLTPADLSKCGTHPALGRVTLGQLLSTWAVHDLHHLRQMALAMAWQYRDEVGPWRAYLNTLAR